MKTWIACIVNWVAIGVVVSIALVAIAVEGTPGTAQANHRGNNYVRSGLYGYSPLSCYPWYGYGGAHACWHSSSIGTAIDYNVDVGGDPYGDVGKEADLILTDSYRTQHWKIAHVTYCKGLEARIYHTTPGNESYYKGQVRYLHINPYGWNNGYTFTGWALALGQVHGGPEISGCGWDGPHLHQDANTAAWTPYYTNWNGNHPFAHAHAICWGGVAC